MISNIFSFSLRGNQVKEGTPNRGVKKGRNSLFYFWTSLPFCIFSNTRIASKRALFKNMKFTLGWVIVQKAQTPFKIWRLVNSTNSTKCSSKESSKILEISKIKDHILNWSIAYCNFGFQSMYLSASELGLVNLRVLSLRACPSLQRKMLV